MDMHVQVHLGMLILLEAGRAAFPHQLRPLLQQGSHVVSQRPKGMRPAMQASWCSV